MYNDTGRLLNPISLGISDLLLLGRMFFLLKYNSKICPESNGVVLVSKLCPCLLYSLLSLTLLIRLKSTSRKYKKRPFIVLETVFLKSCTRQAHLLIRKRGNIVCHSSYTPLSYPTMPFYALAGSDFTSS
jgi:hypothetical protein